VADSALFSPDDAGGSGADQIPACAFLFLPHPLRKNDAPAFPFSDAEITKQEFFPKFSSKARVCEARASYFLPWQGRSPRFRFFSFAKKGPSSFIFIKRRE